MCIVLQGNRLKNQTTLNLLYFMSMHETEVEVYIYINCEPQHILVYFVTKLVVVFTRNKHTGHSKDAINVYDGITFRARAIRWRKT